MNAGSFCSARGSILRSSRGLTLVELAIVMLIWSLMLFLLIGLLLKAREKSREETCADHLRTIIRGVRGYEEANHRFPPGRLKPDWARDGFVQNGYSNYAAIVQTTRDTVGFYSVHVWILPFVDAQNIYNMIDFSRAQAKQLTQGGVRYNINYAAYTKPMPLYLCPDDPNTTDRGIAENNYRYNFGGATIGAGVRSIAQMSVTEPRPTDLYHPGGNGAFTMGEVGLETSAFIDGLSKTAFFSERTKGDGSNPSVTLANNMAIHRFGGPVTTVLTPIDEALQICADTEPQLGPFTLTTAGRWLPNEDFANGWPFAGYDSTQYNHVAPPNWEEIDCGISVIPDTPAEGAIIAARSEHKGKVNVAFGDGHVRRINDKIALVVWRAMGTRNGEELPQDSHSGRAKKPRQD